MSRHPAPRADSAVSGRVAAWTLGVFVLSRLAYWQLGVRFNDYPLEQYWQYLDTHLLRRRLLESLLYLHTQPPLFNAYLGFALKTGHERPVFIATYLLCGLAVYAGSYRLMRHLGVGCLPAFVVATWFATSPAFVAYENWLFYALPVAALHVLAALALFSYLEGRRPVHAAFFFTLVFFVCASRSLYHLAYMATLAVWLALVAGPWKRVLAAAALPLLLLTALYAKNQVLFGHFGGSTWIGKNLARLTTEKLPEAEREQLIEAGALSPVSRAPAFSAPEAYPAAFFEEPIHPGRALSHERKTTGAVNLNHEGYIAVSDRYWSDALWVLRNRPTVYLSSVAQAWGVYFRSSSDLKFLGLANLRALERMLDAYDRIFFGRWPWREDAEAPPRYLTLVVGLPALLVFGLVLALRASAGMSPSQRALLAFLCFNIAYVAAVGNLLELGENNRFRFETDPFSLVLLGVALDALVRRVRRRGEDGRRAA